MRFKTTRTKHGGISAVTGASVGAKAAERRSIAKPRRSARAVGLVALLVAGYLVAPAQMDVRAYRAPNHIVMALRHLQTNEPWNGIVYSDGVERYGVLTWGSSCAVSAKGHLLTANHVVSGGERYVVGGWQDTKKLVAAEVIKRDEENDLAVIKVDPPNDLAWITREFAGTEQVQEGMEVFIWGYLEVPGGFMQFLRRGVISNNTPLDAQSRVLYLETTAAFGSSGSPAFLQNGTPLGIVTSAVRLPGGLPLPAGVAGAIPGEKVNKILREAGVTTAGETATTR